MSDRLAAASALAAPLALTGLAPAALALAALTGPAPAQGALPVQLQKLAAKDGAGNTFYGGSLAGSADLLAVGAPKDNDGAYNAGSVYVYTPDATGWTFAQELLASDPSVDAFFGWAVAVDGDRIAVGAQNADSGAYDSGAAYVFCRSGSLWAEEVRLVPQPPVSGTDFGRALDLQGDTLVVGAPYDDEGPLNATGAVYVFERDGTDWLFTDRLAADDPAPIDELGGSVAIDGDRIVAGAVQGTFSGGFGKAVVFVRAGTTWVEEATLTASDGAIDDQFGAAVDIDGSTVVVGAFRHDSAGINAGAAFVYELTGGSWTERAKLTASNASDYDIFGTAVALQGDRIAVGAIGSVALPEPVYVFDRAGATWTEGPWVVAADVAPYAGTDFGSDLDFDGTRLFVGRSRDGGSIGSAYAFELVPAPAAFCSAKPNACATLPVIGWSGVPSATAPDGFTVTAGQVAAPVSGLLMYGLNGPAALPFLGGTLCVQPPVRRTVITVSGGGTGACDGAFAFDMNAFAAGALGGNPAAPLRQAGTSVHAQWWARDQVPFGVVLSDALVYTVGP